MLDKDDLWTRNFQKNSQRVKKKTDPSRFQRLGGGGLIFMVDQSGDGSGITPSWCTPPFHRWPCTSVRYSVESWLWRGDMSAEFHDRVILHLDADGKAPLLGRKKCSKNKYGGLTARFSENIYVYVCIFFVAKLRNCLHKLHSLSLQQRLNATFQKLRQSNELDLRLDFLLSNLLSTLERFSFDSNHFR